MRVRMLFLQDVLPRYMAGEVKEVTRGYARNYLVPQGLAVMASAEHMKRVAKVKSVAESKRKVVAMKQSDLVAKVEGATLTMRVRAGEGGRLYGSITNMSLADQLKKELGVEIDRRLIELPDPIRMLGTFKVPVKFSADQTATVTVQVEQSNLPGTENATAGEGTAANVRGEDASS